MAERRMFAKKIIDSDAFLEMPLSSQALYFHLSMRADDDGFLNNPKRIMRTVCAAEDDLRVLLTKRFIILFDSGIVVIKHWRMHNYIQKDRYTPTNYIEEKGTLAIKNNNAYTLDTGCIHDGDTGKVRLELGKVRKGKDTLAPWRSDFFEYQSLVKSETQKVIDDDQWMEEQSKLYPELNIKMTIIKACKDYWITEDGWQNKKRRKGALNWKRTYRNAITQKFNWVTAGTHYFDGYASYAEL